ncbi:glutamate-rich protein 2 isoform X4 [Silurus asotus]|uniref:Glutamate-rich protein 2 isoform X4 n=1 Tax=Silurus asotus TaxID=30991 RepID=A0AAD5FGX6_SILAS|nr:glutamate-rich protein 2 isoform X4 [Silurus asotus]
MVSDTTASARISACLTDISSWMSAHQLKLNPSKTELLVIPGLPLNAIRPLQMIQNAAARLVFNQPMFSHTTPLLRSLHWLPVAAFIRFKTLRLTYKAKNGPAPSYLSDLITSRTAPRCLRSSSTARLVPPSLRMRGGNISFYINNLIKTHSSTGKQSDCIFVEIRDHLSVRQQRQSTDRVTQPKPSPDVCRDVLESPIKDAPANKSVATKTQVTLDPELVSELESSCKKTNINHTPSRSEKQAGLQAPAPADMMMHRQKRSPKHSAPGGTGIQTHFTLSYLEEEKTGSSECVHEPVVQVPQNVPVPKCGTGQRQTEARSNDEEEYEEEETADFPAPIELLAEFLKAVMEKKYTLAQKLCQMILIYEPDNPEAKSFLPLIEERLLIEEAQEGLSSDKNTSDDDDDDDDDDEESSSGSEDDDDDDTDTGTDSDGENICSSSDAEENSQR